MAFTDTEKHLAQKEHYERLLNVEFPWDKESLVLVDKRIPVNEKRIPVDWNTSMGKATV